MKVKSVFSLTAIAFVGSLLFFSSASQGSQEKSPSLAQRAPIGDLTQTEGISISGTIVAWGEADENEFVLEDESGRVTVDAGPRWWKDLNLNLGDAVTVQGEMDDGEFDAFSITYADGTVVEIRSAHDEEPWEKYED